LAKIICQAASTYRA